MSESSDISLNDLISKGNESLQQPAIIQEISGDAQLENVKEILNDDPSQINAKDSREGMEGYTALHYACWDAKTDIAKYLIKQGADVHIKGTKDNATALLLCNNNNAQLLFKSCLRLFIVWMLFRCCSTFPVGVGSACGCCFRIVWFWFSCGMVGV